MVAGALRDRLFVGGGFSQIAAIVAGPQPHQRGLVRREMVDSGRQARQVSAHNVELDRVKRAGGSSGPVMDLPRQGQIASADQSRRVVKQLSQGMEVQLTVGENAGCRYGLQRRHPGRRELGRQRDLWETGIRFVEARFGFEVDIAKLGRLVKLPSLAGLADLIVGHR